MAKPKAEPKNAKQDEDSRYERASATLLAQEPAFAPKQKDGANLPDWLSLNDWGQLRGHLEGRLMNLRAWRTSWWMQNWSDLAEFILPRRSIWLTQSAGGLPTPNNMTRGREINNSIVDPTATFAVRICTGGLVSGLASQSRPWFKLFPTNKNVEIDAAGRAWLDETESRVYKILALSNFYSSFTIKCEDVITFGTAPRIIYDDETTVIHCYNPCVGEYYVANDATLRPNVLARQFLMTVTQMVDFFGLESCPPDVQKLWQQKGAGMDQERIVGHFIEPNYSIANKGSESSLGVVPGNFTWREVYWTWGSAGAGPLSIRGFVEKPFTVSRWAVQSNDAYGRSPAMDVLPDVLQLQVETQRKAEAIEKQVRPPLVADMSMKNQPSSILPGHVTYVQKLGSESGMRPMYEVKPDIAAMSQDIALVQQRIKVGLFNDLFGMFQDMPSGKMTAYETAQRVNERLQIIGPVIEGLLGDLKEELKRVFGIMKRKGLIDEPPDSLKKIPLNIEFVSMLALASKAAATGGIERIVALVGNMAAVDPQAKDMLDFDAVIAEMNDLLGNPQHIIRDKKTVAAMRQQQAQAMQQQQQLANVQQGVNTAAVGAQAAQVMSNTQVGQGQNVLDRLLSGTSRQ